MPVETHDLDEKRESIILDARAELRQVRALPQLNVQANSAARSWNEHANTKSFRKPVVRERLRDMMDPFVLKVAGVLRLAIP